MPGPSNTLLIEGTFSELAEELAQYIDTLAKAEEGAGVQAEIEQLLGAIREAEQSQESSDDASLSKQKDEVLKKIVTKAAVLNSAPERGTHSHLEFSHRISVTNSRYRILGGIQFVDQPVIAVIDPRPSLCTDMPILVRTASHIIPDSRKLSRNPSPNHRI